MKFSRQVPSSSTGFEPNNLYAIELSNQRQTASNINRLHSRAFALLAVVVLMSASLLRYSGVRTVTPFYLATFTCVPPSVAILNCNAGGGITVLQYINERQDLDAACEGGFGGDHLEK